MYKITFRFEVENGNLYDFKGVDHNITYIIYYYKPKFETKEEFKSILNPDTYTNIKSDEFYVGGVLDVNDDDVISSHFIKYRIYLN